MQETVSGTALGGVVKGGQLITENEKSYSLFTTSSSCNFHPLQGHAIAVL